MVEVVKQRLMVEIIVGFGEIGGIHKEIEQADDIVDVNAAMAELDKLILLRNNASGHDWGWFKESTHRNYEHIHSENEKYSAFNRTRNGFRVSPGQSYHMYHLESRNGR